MKLLNIVFLIAVLAGCKAKKAIAPVVVPCPEITETVKHDTIIEVITTPQYVDRVVLQPIEGEKVFIKTSDTIYTTVEQKVIIRTLTKQVENLDRVNNALFKRDSVINLLNEQIKENNALQSSYQRLKGKNSTKIWWIGSLILLLILLIALWVRKQFSFKLPF